MCVVVTALGGFRMFGIVGVRHGVKGGTTNPNRGSTDRWVAVAKTNESQVVLTFGNSPMWRCYGALYSTRCKTRVFKVQAVSNFVMICLADAPKHIWATVAGVATDLDDTLTAHRILTSSSLIALSQLAERGIPCVIATGRPIGWAEVLASLLPVKAVVAENGGAWAIREQQSVRVAFLDSEHTRMEGMARSRACATHLTQRFPELQFVQETSARVTDVTLDVGERVQVSREVIHEALEVVHTHGLYGVASTVHLHVSYRAPDKMGGLRAAFSDMGMDATALDHHWIYLGDSPNDAGPFAAIELSIGVRGVERFASVMPALPRYITHAGAGDALAEVLEVLR
jgi:HAD superfamily hydrolase (TIGR01484 family)